MLACIVMNDMGKILISWLCREGCGLESDLSLSVDRGKCVAAKDAVDGTLLTVAPKTLCLHSEYPEDFKKAT